MSRLGILRSVLSAYAQLAGMIVTVCVLIAASAVIASADYTNPLGSIGGWVGVGGANGYTNIADAPGEVNFTYGVGSSYTGSAYAITNGSSISTYAAGYTSAEAYGSYNYEITYSGLTAATSVPVIFQGSVLTSLTGGAFEVQSRVSISYGYGSQISFIAQANSLPYIPAGQLFNTEVYVPVNVAGSVVMSAIADTMAYNGDISLASVATSIEIDPNFLAANPGYSLQLSDGADNPPITPTPIPAAVYLLGSGLLGLFGIKRRKAQ